MARKTRQEKRWIVFVDGTEVFITGETDRYYLCGKRQFRKSNPTIISVREKVLEKEEMEIAKETEA